MLKSIDDNDFAEVKVYEYEEAEKEIAIPNHLPKG